MNIMLIGPSGAGKGVQAKLLIAKYGFNYVVMGDLLRKEAQENPEMKARMEKGMLVPTEETFELVKKAFSYKAPENAILDGFPRTIDQFDLLKPWLTEVNGKFDLVLVLRVPDEKLIERLSARRMDPVTGKIYNLITDKPPVEVDVNILVQRDDDKPEAVAKRLGWFHDSVEPLIDVLKKELHVVEIDGDRPIEAIHQELVGLVEGLKDVSR